MLRVKDIKVLIDPDFTGNLTPKLTMRWESALSKRKSKIKVKPGRIQ